MLTNLHIKNLILIDEIDMDLSPGLNILTGETGVGKSIIIDSVLAGLGAKADRNITDEDKTAFVELSFSGQEKDIKPVLSEYDISPEEDEPIVFTRKIKDGRSVMRINGETVSLSDARKISSYLLNIYAQNEFQTLLNKNEHLEIIDSYSGEDAAKLKTRLSECVSSLKKTQKEIESLTVSDSDRERITDLLKYEKEEIEKAAIREGEPEELEAAYRKALNAEKIAESVSDVQRYLGNEQDGAESLTGNALLALGQVKDSDDALSEFYDRISEIEVLLGEINRDISDYTEDLLFAPGEFEAIERRYDEVNRILSKYGGSYESLIEALNKRYEELEAVENASDRLKVLNNEKKALLAHMELLAEELSGIRKRKGSAFSKEVSAGLKDLNFARADFDVEFKRKETIDEKGYDDVQFIISTNPGQPLKPLIKVASGGELSRVMLAIKSLMSSENSAGTIIFDEIDSGISGKTAYKVAEKLKSLSRNRQVICITHLPQIAAMADSHYVVEKTVTDTKASTGIRKLDEESSVLEIARMMGGETVTENTVLAAKEMKNMTKKEI